MGCYPNWDVNSRTVRESVRSVPVFDASAILGRPLPIGGALNHAQHYLPARMTALA